MRKTTRAAARRAPAQKKSAPAKAAQPVAPSIVEQKPLTEWERATALVALFVATGRAIPIAHAADVLDNKGQTRRAKPQSLMLVSDPGRGKTELVERFRPNRILSFHSDLTVRPFWRLVGHAKAGALTHIVATEFQKWFQRKSSTAENLVGSIVQAMEEGIDRVDVGPRTMDFGGARLGLIGAVTHGTIERQRERLEEMGFLSRAAVFPWELPREEMKDILTRIGNGTTDVSPVNLHLPDDPVLVIVPPAIMEDVAVYVWRMWPDNPLRVFQRFRGLLAGCALLRGAREVTVEDWAHLMSYDDYWQRMILG